MGMDLNTCITACTTTACMHTSMHNSMHAQQTVGTTACMNDRMHSHVSVYPAAWRSPLCGLRPHSCVCLFTEVGYWSLQFISALGVLGAWPVPTFDVSAHGMLVARPLGYVASLLWHPTSRHDAWPMHKNLSLPCPSRSAGDRHALQPWRTSSALGLDTRLVAPAPCIELFPLLLLFPCFVARSFCFYRVGLFAWLFVCSLPRAQSRSAPILDLAVCAWRFQRISALGCSACSIALRSATPVLDALRRSGARMSARRSP